MVREIPFYSMCEHHLVPFHGQAHVAYMPKVGSPGSPNWRGLSRGLPAGPDAGATDRSGGGCID